MTSQRLKQELEGYRGAMSNIEATLSQVAGATQMETLALVVEEQRRRIDSILTGKAVDGKAVSGLSLFRACATGAAPGIEWCLRWCSDSMQFVAPWRGYSSVVRVRRCFMGLCLCIHYFN